MRFIVMEFHNVWGKKQFHRWGGKIGVGVELTHHALPTEPADVAYLCPLLLLAVIFCLSALLFPRRFKCYWVRAFYVQSWRTVVQGKELSQNFLTGLSLIFHSVGTGIETRTPRLAINFLVLLLNNLLFWTMLINYPAFSEVYGLFF